MDSFSVLTFLSVALLMIWCVQVESEQSCDHTEFLHPNGTCVVCPVCGPGEQLSEDCGFGDGGKAVCLVCESGRFSSDTGVAPCKRCTKCNLLNRLQKTACSPARDAQCGPCLPEYYELRSMTGEVELSCLPCTRHDTVHKECLLFSSQGPKAESDVTMLSDHFKEPEERRIREERKTSMVLIGSATASSIFLIALLLWALLLTTERFKQVLPDSGPEGLLSEADLQHTALEKKEPSSQAAKDSSRGLNSLSHENEVHPTSIVINVTTNIKPSSQRTDSITQQTQHRSCYSAEEMEQKLQTIWEMAQGHSIEVLDYDTIQDLSLLLDSADSRDLLRRFGQSLGVPPQIIAHLQGFQDLFQYLRTSTYTLLPQLAQAAALLPFPDIVARIHRAVVNK